MAKEEEKIIVKPLRISRLKLQIVGKTPYLPEPMDMAVIDRYDKKKSNQTYDKDKISEEDKAKEKYYFTNDGKKGIPARAFYNAMIRASSYLFDKKDGGMRNVREGLNVLGDVLPLKYKKEIQLLHWGRQSGQSKAPRKIIRNSFEDWSCELEIEYNQEQLSPENIVNILNWSGFHIGVGGFRKEKTGNFGSFQVLISR
jgi:hypothetical protein